MMCLACDKAFNPADTPGALIIGPPEASNYCKKDHLCADCYPIVVMEINKIAGPK